LHDAVALEARGRPTAVVLTRAFEHEAKLQRVALGADDLAVACITHPVSTLTADQIEARALEAAPQVVKILTGR